MEQKKSPKATRRALLLLAVFLLSITLMFSRFVYIQAAKEVQGHNLQELLEKRWSQSKVLEGKRGTIFDRNGEALAEEIASYSIIAILDERYSSRVEDPRETALKLSEVLEIDASVIEEYLVNGIANERVQVELGSRSKYLSYEVKQAIEEMELPGIQLRKDPKRYYPKQTFASHILGYTERDMSTARMGLESSLDEYLKEEAGRISYQKDGNNRRLVNANEIIDPAKNGDDVYLTLDSRIQMAIEQTMNQVEEEFDPERMMAIVANAKTGEILGMSNRPSFNPNQYESIQNYTNYNVSSRFEPGSTMKIFTLAAAIEDGVYNGEETFKSGAYQLGDHTIRDHHRGGWGEISFDEGFLRSSNVGFSILALEKLGPERLYNYITEFGFDQPTGIDLPNETTGLIANTWRSDAATTAFGQGSAVTPIQQIQAATAIANNGKMMKPYVIDRIVNKDDGNVSLNGQPEVAGQPVSAETSKKVLKLMEGVVSSDAGTGRPYAIEGFNVAGKTGTAQIRAEDGPGYLSGDGNFIYSFLGMAPAEDPEIIVYVAVDRPDLETHQPGNLPVSMIFKSVMNQSLQYLNISPTEDTPGLQEEEENLMPEMVGEVLSDAEEILTGKGFNIVSIGDGTEVTSQYPPPGINVMNKERVLLVTDGDTVAMPDMENWSLRYVYAFKEMLDLSVEIDGHGYVYSQSPEPGETIRNGRIRISLAPPGEANNNAEDIANQTANEENENEDEEEEEEEEEEFFMD